MHIKLILLAVAGVGSFLLTSCDSGVYYGAAYQPGYHGSRGHINVLPYGYRTIHVRGKAYYYHNNFWYHRNNGRYYRCSRPSGYHGSLGRISGNHYGQGHLTRLPRGYRSHYLSGTRYYSHGNLWYKYRSGRYYRVSRPSSYKPSYKPSYRSSSYSSDERPNSKARRTQYVKNQKKDRNKAKQQYVKTTKQQRVRPADVVTKLREAHKKEIEKHVGRRSHLRSN